jgi:hypothetical protein
MPTFNEFTDWLFPGDELPRTANPTVPTEVMPLLEEVQCKTGVPLEWLEKTSQLVINGLAGAQCLWFLHGAKGSIVDQETLESGPPVNAGYEINEIMKKLSDKADAKRQGLGYDVDWHEGYITIQTFDMAKSWEEPISTRRMKLGKWLRKQGASAEVIKSFETRQLPTWDWEISAHPYDVLTMSFRRPWTSCMRPPDPENYKEAGEAQYGPLTDLAAGSAIMFFYRPGAGVPCGRMMLRPALGHYGDGPIIVSGHRVYGCGPGNVLTVPQLQPMLAPFLPASLAVTTQEPYLCSLGADGRALSRFIYSDTDNNFCRQTNEMYDEAYDALINAAWPEPQVPMEESWSITVEFQGEIDTGELGLEDVEAEIDIRQLATNAHDLAIEENTWDDILDALRDPSGDTLIPDAIAGSLPNNTPDYIYDDLLGPVDDLLKESLIRAANEHTTLIYALEAGTPYDLVDDLVDQYAGYAQTPEYSMVSALLELDISPNVERAAHFTADGEEVEAVVFISDIFNPHIPEGLSRRIVADGTVVGHNWTEGILQVLR